MSGPYVRAYERVVVRLETVDGTTVHHLKGNFVEIDVDALWASRFAVQLRKAAEEIERRLGENSA
jgi:hypothetical protein